MRFTVYGWLLLAWLGPSAPVGADVDRWRSMSVEALEQAIIAGEIDPHRGDPATGERPLHAAAELGPEWVEVLVLAGARVNAVDTRGRTALHAAVEAGTIAALKPLMRHGADPGQPDRRGVSASALARQRGDVHASAYLERYDPNALARGRDWLAALERGEVEVPHVPDDARQARRWRIARHANTIASHLNHLHGGVPARRLAEALAHLREAVRVREIDTSDRLTLRGRLISVNPEEDAILVRLTPPIRVGGYVLSAEKLSPIEEFSQAPARLRPGAPVEIYGVRTYENGKPRWRAFYLHQLPE